MEKNGNLIEELSRMRKLMGMSGQLYQKPIMEDESKHHSDEQPNPRDYRGGETNPQYRTDFTHWSRDHQTPAPTPRPPSPSPRPPSPSPSPSPRPAAPKDLSSKTVSKKGTGARSALDSGQFVVPATQKSGKSKKG